MKKMRAFDSIPFQYHELRFFTRDENRRQHYGRLVKKQKLRGFAHREFSTNIVIFTHEHQELYVSLKRRRGSVESNIKFDVSRDKNTCHCCFNNLYLLT